MFDPDWFDELKRDLTVQPEEYAEYLRLEMRKRTIVKELEDINHQQRYIGGKIKSIWARDGIRNKKFGDTATFFLKDNLVINPCVAVGQPEIVKALEQAGFDDLLYTCVDEKGLRDLVRKSNGKLPDELVGLLTVWGKQDLYIRIKKEKSNDSE